MPSRVALASVAVALAATAAQAEPSEPLPAGRFAVLGGVRTGTGALFDTIGTGAVFGVEAGYAPLRAPQTIGIGLSWSFLWSYYFADSARIADSMSMVELDAGVRVRLVLGARRRSVVYIGGGPALTRTNEPLFVDGDRSYVAGWGAIGVETLEPFGGFLVTTSVRFASIDNGRGTIGLMLSIGSGR